MGGHGFGHWFERYHDTHPEYFALQPDGTRSGYPKPRVAKMCLSNPDVAAQWMTEVAEELEKLPIRRVFNAASNDGYFSGHCICSDCRSWDHPDGEPVLFNWQGVAQKYVALSDRHVTFANHLARMIENKYPDRELYVTMLAYGNARTPPIDVKPHEDRLIVGLVHNFYQRTWSGDFHYDLNKKNYMGWTEVTANHLWRPNVGTDARWKKGGPTDLTGAIESFRMLNETGAIGMHTDHVYESWLTQGPLYYLMAQLAWDPSRDGRDVLADYYQRGFGPAASQVESFWRLMEEARNEVAKRKEGKWADGFDDALFQRTESVLNEAEQKLEGAPEKYRERLNLVRQAQAFLRLTTENLKLVERIEESHGEDQDAYTKAKANWDRIEAIAKQYEFPALPVNILRNPARGHVKDIYPDSQD